MDGSRHSTKKLLHWLNTLPFTSCLLVDSFAGLQNGAVLFDIAAAIVAPSTLETPPTQGSATTQASHKIQQVLTCVVPHVSKHTNGYHIRDPDTILDILDGNIPAICATLEVLKMLWLQKEIRSQQKQYVHDQVRKLHPPPPVAQKNRKLNNAWTPPPPHRLVPKVFRAQPTVAWNMSTVISNEKPPRLSDDHTPKDKPAGQQLRENYHVQFMVDPLWLPTNKEYPPRPASPTPPALDIQEAYNVCRWIRSLGIGLPFDKYREPLAADSFLEQAGRVFKDGVILCQIAAILAYRSGKPFIKAKLRPLLNQPGCFVPQGCSITRLNVAQKRHNLQLALSFLDMPIVAKLTHLDDPNSPHFVQEIWLLLHAVYKASTKPPPPPPKNIQAKEPSKAPQKTTRLPCITHEQTTRVREWLTSMGIMLPTESHPLLQDPLRNGSLLCNLLNRMGNLSKPIKAHNKPTALHQAKENVFLALSALRQLNFPSIPPVYIAKSEPILKGQFQFVWGLLYHVMESLQAPPLLTHVQETPVAADTETVANDKILVVDWLRTQGYLDNLEAAQVHPTFDDIQIYVQNGILLLLLAAQLTQKPVKIDKTINFLRNEALKNIVDALEQLRSVPNMPQRYLWCEDKIYAGHSSVILGLLQDIKRIHGDKPSSKQHVVHPVIVDPIYDDISIEGDIHAEELVKCWHINTQVNSSHQWRETDIDPAEDLFPQPHQDDLKLTYLWPTDDDVIPQRQEFKLESSVGELEEWLKQLHIDIGPSHALDGSVLSSFQNGLVLVDLIEKVEHLRRLEGVCRNPQGKRANCLHNIRKVLEILRQKKTMPLSLLRREKDICAGNPQVILPLLDHIRKAYGYHRGKKP
ncbi:hypothetical protein LEN26_012305 [Aphanomyces euteiches]|nr:hypothetical protein LEN26_012305 [Aphanomyces euteiches]